MIWIYCGCCGRVHEDLPSIDCRSFVTCDSCGDNYLNTQIVEHERQCKGDAASCSDDAEWNWEDSEGYVAEPAEPAQP